MYLDVPLHWATNPGDKDHIFFFFLILYSQSTLHSTSNMKSLDLCIEMSQPQLCPDLGDRCPKMDEHDGKLLFTEVLQPTQDFTL